MSIFMRQIWRLKVLQYISLQNRGGLIDFLRLVGLGSTKGIIAELFDEDGIYGTDKDDCVKRMLRMRAGWMDNSLLAVRGNNHKYIVVGGDLKWLRKLQKEIIMYICEIF